LEAKGSIVIGVKEAHDVEEFCFAGVVRVVVSQEVEQVAGWNAAAGVPIKSLEGRVRGKVFYLAQALAQALKLVLTFAHSHQKILETVFRFETKHLQSEWVWAKGGSREFLGSALLFQSNKF